MRSKWSFTTTKTPLRIRTDGFDLDSYPPRETIQASAFVRAADGSKLGGMRVLMMEQAIAVRGRSLALEG
jgi:hypothetical protein